VTNGTKRRLPSDPSKHTRNDRPNEEFHITGRRVAAGRETIDDGVRKNEERGGRLSDEKFPSASGDRKRRSLGRLGVVFRTKRFKVGSFGGAL